MKKMTRLMALVMALLMVGVMVAASALAADDNMASDGNLATKAPSGDDSMASDGNLATKAPAATEAPATATPAPTKKPSSSSAATYATAEPTEEPVDNVVVLDEADEDAGYAGSILTYLENGSILLTSSYTAENMTEFKAWAETVTDAEALNATEIFAEFVKHAKTLVTEVLPELTEEEVDELLVAILTSDVSEVELTEEELAVFFGDAEISEVLGLYTQENYEFCLAETEDSVLLGVREIAE